MNVLLTGATGYIGGAVGEAFHGAGHEVWAVAHTAEVEREIGCRGWRSIRADLREPETLQAPAVEADAVVHAANTGGADAAPVDTGATRALLDALRGTGKSLLYTSGAWVLGGGDSDERSPVNPPNLVGWRGALEAEVLGRAPSVRSVVIRPGIVYGRGAGIPGKVGRGEIPVVGAGHQRWPLVHVEDLADLYLRALHAPAGSILHGVSATLSMRDVAMLGAGGRGDRIVAISLEEAMERFSDFAEALALDQEVSSMRTRQITGWRPRGPSPVAELLAA